ncbi:MAG: peptide chain release factor N(5)-glutamine methyltransferase [Cellulomonadaceae bacterium]
MPESVPVSTPVPAPGSRPGALLRWARAVLGEAKVPTPRVDAELLLAHVLGVGRGEVVRLAVLDAPVPGACAEAFAALVDRRALREPLQHLTGTAPFRNLELAVGPGVFVPRPETEQVAQVAINEAAAVLARTGAVAVVDLCTGSGALALAVVDEVPGAEVHAVELDEARRNTAALGNRVHLVRGDARTALGELDGRCDVVVSNPPYVPPGAVPREAEVSRFDPQVALYGLGPDGLEVPRGVVTAAARLLRPGGLLVMEHAEVQADAACAILAARGFVDVATMADLTGRPRMAVGRRGADLRPGPGVGDFPS